MWWIVLLLTEFTLMLVRNGEYEKVGIKFANHLNVAIRRSHSNFLIILNKC